MTSAFLFSVKFFAKYQKTGMCDYETTSFKLVIQQIAFLHWNNKKLYMLVRSQITVRGSSYVITSSYIIHEYEMGCNKNNYNLESLGYYALKNELSSE